MTIIPLRAYNREIEGLIDSSQLDEAVAHCRHILLTYPKYIASYRLLGKAHLEQQRISDATDIFQRVLSSVPDDFIANLGMSIIREDENNLDAAIWHMELAYEAQPANVAIQDELRRLYGRRDGVQPPKVRLTRGALARMYSKGGLFDQAIAELRSAIAEDPNRTDLQLLLAEMFYQTAQRIEAVEACANIIKKIPYCLLANRILAISLSEAEGSEAVKNYQQVVISLDPYYAFASPEAITSEQVPENAVNIERLDWKSGIQVEEAPPQPNWATSLGISIEKTADENLPDWLKSAEAPETSSTGEKSTSSVSPFIWDTQEVQNIISDTSKPEGEIPDWMKDAGWQPATGEATPPPDEVTSEEPSSGTPADEHIEQGEMPDWLRGVTPETPEGEGASQPEQHAEADLSSPWLEQHQPGPTDSIIQWLDETKPESSIPPLAEDEDLSAALDEEIPDWLKDLEVPSTPFTEEGESTTSPDDSSTPPSAFLEESSPPEVAEAIPSPGEQDVAQIDQAATSDVEVGLTAEQKTTSPLEGSDAVELSTPETPESEGLAEEALDEIPDWLREMAEEQPSQESPSSEPKDIEIETSTISESEVETISPASLDQPLSEEGVTIGVPPSSPDISESHEPGEQEIPEGEIPVVFEAPSKETPPNLEQESQTEIMTPAEGELSSTETGLPSEPDSLDWLDELTAEQGDMDEDLVSSTEVSSSEWVNLEPTLPSEESVLSDTGSEMSSALPSEEIPDWIKGLGEESEGDDNIAQPETEELAEQPEEVEAPGQPEIEAAPEQAEEVAEAEPSEMEAVSEQPEEVTEAELSEMEIVAEQAEDVVEAEPPEMETVAEQTEEVTEAESSEMETVAEQIEEVSQAELAEMEGVAEQAEFEAAPEQAEEVAEAESPEMEAVAEQSEEVTEAEPPEMEPVTEQPEEVVEAEVPEMEAAPEQPEELATPEQPEQEAVIEEPVQEVTPEEEISPEEELPAWLLELEEPETEEEQTGSPEETPELETEELPAWVQEITEGEPASEEPDVVIPTQAEIQSSPLEEAPQPPQEVVQAEAVEPPEAEVPASMPVKEQATVETEPVVAEENQRLLAEARSFIDQDQLLQAVNSYTRLIKQNYQLEEIIRDLSDAVYRFPVDPEVWVSLGDVYFRNDQLEEALNAYNKAEELAR